MTGFLRLRRPNENVLRTLVPDTQFQLLFNRNIFHKLLFLTFESEPFIDVTESTCIILTSFHLLGLLKLIYKSTNLALNEATIRACRLVWHPVSSILTVFPFAFPFARMETRSDIPCNTYKPPSLVKI